MMTESFRFAHDIHFHAAQAVICVSCRSAQTPIQALGFFTTTSLSEVAAAILCACSRASQLPSCVILRDAKLHYSFRSPMLRLPMPGSPSASWATYRARLRAVFDGADPRVCAAFWLFGRYWYSCCIYSASFTAALGLMVHKRHPSQSANIFFTPALQNTELTACTGLINNVLYVIILSAALDLVGPDVPKGLVLLADVIPSFLTKLCAPYFIHKIPYAIRIPIFVALSACGMLILSITPALQDPRTISIKMCGVILASLSSGGGELSFLGLTHFYNHFALASWGSGTGGAGLIGAGAYAIATTTLKISPRTSLLAFSFLPIIMVISFFVILPRGPIRHSSKSTEYEPIQEDEPEDLYNESAEDSHPHLHPAEHEGLLSTNRSSRHSLVPSNDKGIVRVWTSFKANLNRSKGLFLP